MHSKDIEPRLKLSQRGDRMIKLVERMVFSGIDGRALLPLLAVLIYVVIGQAKEIVNEIKKVWQEVE